MELGRFLPVCGAPSRRGAARKVAEEGALQPRNLGTKETCPTNPVALCRSCSGRVRLRTVWRIVGGSVSQVEGSR